MKKYIGVFLIMFAVGFATISMSNIRSTINIVKGYLDRRAYFVDLHEEYVDSMSNMSDTYDVMSAKNPAINVTEPIEVTTALGGIESLSFLSYVMYSVDNEFELVEGYKSEDITTLNTSKNTGVILELSYHTEDLASTLSSLDTLNLPIKSIEYKPDTSVINIKILCPRGSE